MDNYAVINKVTNEIENIIVWEGVRLVDITANPEYHIGGTLTAEGVYTPPPAPEPEPEE